MPKAFTPAEKEYIRDQLLDQADQQFSAHGLRKTSIAELTRAVGISKAAFYIFFESKEALFMEVVELAEQRFRQEVLSAVDQPGSSPRARLVAVLRRAFTLWRAIPLLHTFTRADYDRLTRRVPLETIRAHMASDREFIQQLVARCREAEIPIRAPVSQITGLMYALFLTVLHEDDFGEGQLAGATDLLLELVAAFCLGEVEIHVVEPALPFPNPGGDDSHEPGD